MIPAISAFQAEMTDWRRDLHAHPETAFEEHRTATFIAGKLAGWGIEVHGGIGGTGVVGLLRNGTEGRRIGLRADMDALVMAEGNGFAHASRFPGVFHGCGHDGHVAMLLGAARHLAATRRFAGTVAFIFQPAEEGFGGARRMLADGLFERFPCDEIYALHNRPTLPLGQIAVRPGAMMAASDEFRARVVGKGGHAASPHLCVDPLLAAAHLVTAWQSLVSRRADPSEAVVVSVTEFHAGTAFNVIPEEAVLGGTVRSHREDIRERLESELGEVARGIATAFGVEIVFDYRRGYSPTVNHGAEAAFAAAAARQVVGAENVRGDLPPAMGAEDFGEMLEARPGAYLWLGQDDVAAGRGGRSLHSPHYDFNDDALVIGASLLATLVELSR